ncbi:uncharacterized protein LOC109429013 [Aedes albopictus]|uniref:F-box domain-containing protein n=1 Tax=Aedes albopictus TaxID=7160 RepID=A0ABM1ZTJ5_AEDAL|nr:uncharacterized protein LOC109429013 [Aedes albopictus]
MASFDWDLTFLNNLPNAVLREIFRYLPVEDRKTASLICRHWEQEAFSVELLADVRLCLSHHTLNNSAKTLFVLCNSWRKYRNVVFRLAPFGMCSYFQYTFIVQLLDMFGQIEEFTLRKDCSAELLKEFLNRMPRLKRLTVCLKAPQECSIERLEFPVMHKLREMDISIREDTTLKNQQFDMLRVAPNVQRLRLYFSDPIEHVRAMEMLKAYANQLKMLDLSVLYAWLPIDELQLEKLEILKLQEGSRELEVHRLHRLLERLRELKAVHLGFKISQSTLEVISSSCPKLNTLDIRSDYLEVGALKHLNNMPNLQIFMVNRLHETFLEVSEPVIVGIKELRLLVGSTALSHHAYAYKLVKVFPHVSGIWLSKLRFRIVSANSNRK